MTRDDAIQFLMDFAQDARRVHSREVPVDVLFNNFDKRKKLS